MLIRLFTILLFVISPNVAFAFDIDFEGRFRAGSEYIFDPPPGFAHFTNEVELRMGVLGNVIQGDDWSVDYELVGDLLHVGGPFVQAGFQDDFDADFFRAWLRLEKGNFKIRGGRQQILFGSGSIFRPLGFFDTRNVAGIIPLTRGVDGVRATWFPTTSSTIEGWVIPAKFGSGLISGLRGEMLFAGVEAGIVAQYHPKTKLSGLPDFDQELIQLGYHFKGEKAVGYWSEGRFDIENKSGQSYTRFQNVIGTDYTFDLGQGLHVLLEYFVSTQEKGFTLKDIKGDRTIHQLGLMFSQPIGIDIVWQIFTFMDVLDRSFQIVPQVEYSISEQVFLYVRAKVGGSINGDDSTGRLFRKLPVINGSESSIGAAVVAFF